MKMGLVAMSSAGSTMEYALEYALDLMKMWPAKMTDAANLVFSIDYVKELVAMNMGWAMKFVRKAGSDAAFWQAVLHRRSQSSQRFHEFA